MSHSPRQITLELNQKSIAERYLENPQNSWKLNILLNNTRAGNMGWGEGRRGLIWGRGEQLQLLILCRCSHISSVVAPEEGKEETGLPRPLWSGSHTFQGEEVFSVIRGGLAPSVFSEILVCWEPSICPLNRALTPQHWGRSPDPNSSLLLQAFPPEKHPCSDFQRHPRAPCLMASWDTSAVSFPLLWLCPFRVQLQPFPWEASWHLPTPQTLCNPSLHSCPLTHSASPSTTPCALPRCCLWNYLINTAMEEGRACISLISFCLTKSEQHRLHRKHSVAQSYLTLCNPQGL